MEGAMEEWREGHLDYGGREGWSDVGIEGAMEGWRDEGSDGAMVRCRDIGMEGAMEGSIEGLRE